MLTRLRTNLLKLKHHVGFAKLTRKLVTANIALHSVFTQILELNLNNQDIFTQACINVF